jgi:hypothetical protein
MVGRSHNFGVHFFRGRCLRIRGFAVLLWLYAGFTCKKLLYCVCPPVTSGNQNLNRLPKTKRAAKVTMATNSKTQKAPAQPTVCVYCGKTIKRAKSVGAGCGSKCAAIAAKYTPAQLQTHALAQVGTVPSGYITVASLHRTIVSKKHSVPGLNVNKMVRAIGGDRALNTPVHAIAKPIYNGRQRWVNPWLATPAGLNAIATGQWAKAPAK